MSTYKHSEAFCKTAPIVAEGYEPKGKYIELAGWKACQCDSRLLFQLLYPNTAVLRSSARQT